MDLSNLYIFAYTTDGNYDYDVVYVTCYGI